MGKQRDKDPKGTMQGKDVMLDSMQNEGRDMESSGPEVDWNKMPGHRRYSKKGGSDWGKM